FINLRRACNDTSNWISEKNRAQTKLRMKNLVVLLSGLLSLPLTLPAAETAQARLFCLSVRFHQGTDDSGFYYLDLSTTGFINTPNGELAPTFSPPDQFSSFLLSDDSGPFAMGDLVLNLPPLADVNDNGFDDFFESALGVAGTSTGNYSSPVDSGTI